MNAQPDVNIQVNPPSFWAAEPWPGLSFDPFGSGVVGNIEVACVSRYSYSIKPIRVRAEVVSFDQDFGELKIITHPSTELTLSAQRGLGDVGSDRFTTFSQLDAGWGGDGSPINHESISAVNAFFDEGGRFPSPPSLFMLKDGSLQLVGESFAGGVVELDFRKGHVYFYSGDSDEEGYVDTIHEGFGKLVRLTKQQDA